MRESGYGHNALHNSLYGKSVIRHDKLDDVMAAMRRLIDDSSLAERTRTDLLAKIERLPAIVRVERVVTEIHRHPNRFKPR